MKIIVPVWLILFLSGCATYAPPTPDEKTGMYPAMASLDAGAIESEIVDVDLGKYRFVYLNAETNVYPSRFEFFVREALVGFGFKHILNQDELVELISNRSDVSEISSISDPIEQRKLSNAIGPILYVEFNSRWDGDVSRYVTVMIVDMSSGDVLLKIVHPKTIWWNVDSEAHYPVLNAIKSWIDKCKERGVTA